jgi:hypothetical protein
MFIVQRCRVNKCNKVLKEINTSNKDIRRLRLIKIMQEYKAHGKISPSKKHEGTKKTGCTKVPDVSDGTLDVTSNICVAWAKYLAED